MVWVLKMKYRVIDIMSTPPITLNINASVKEAARLMFDNRIGSVLIVDEEEKLRGIVTERDLIYLVATGKTTSVDEYPVWQIMTENPITIAPHEPVTRALAIMREANIRHLPVVDEENKPIGVISIRDVVNYIVEVIGLLKR